MVNYDISGSTMPVYVGKSGFADVLWFFNFLGRLTGYAASEFRPFTMSNLTYDGAYLDSGHHHTCYHLCITSEERFGGAPLTSFQGARGDVLQVQRLSKLRYG